MSPSVRDYLRHILDEANYLTDRSQGLDKEKLLHDETLKRAFVRSLEIIGEAAPHGVWGQRPLRFAGTIRLKGAQGISEASEQGCGRGDANGW